jgi:acid phosphatase
MTHPRRVAGLGVLAAIALLAAAASPLGEGAAPASAAGPCGLRSVPAPITHVVVIMDENKQFPQIIGPPGSQAAAQAPYLNALARSCGLATNYHAITHGSRPDYMAITSGVPSRTGTTTARSIFSQLQNAGKTWRIYAQSMPANCYRHDLGEKSYKTGHNAALWYTELNPTCPLYDVPMGTNWTRVIWANALRSYSFIVPDNCHDVHSCANQITRGDDFLRTTIGQIVSTPDYQDGHVAIFITWDEGTESLGSSVTENCLAKANLSDPSCHVPLIVVSASTRPGTVVSAMLDHDSVLRASEALLGLPLLPEAAAAPGGIEPDFNL